MITFGSWGSRPRLFRCRPFGAGLEILEELLRIDVDHQVVAGILR